MYLATITPCLPACLPDGVTKCKKKKKKKKKKTKLQQKEAEAETSMHIVPHR